MRVADRAEPIEHASREELESLQLTRLKQIVRRAYERVPHYRTKLDEAGAHPDDVKELDDLVRLPFTSKDDLRQNYPFGLFAVPLGEISRIHASSGSTGKPTVAGYTRGDIETWAELMARSIRAAGGKAGDRMHVANAYGLFTGGLGFHYGAERLGCTVIPVGGGFTERQVQLIRDFEPDIIAVTPSYLLAIADAFEQRGLDARQCSLRLALCGAEPWSEAMRAEIEARLGVVAYDCYGLSEIVGPGVGMERVGEKGALTVWEDHFLPEIVEPETGRRLPDGEAGELVLTTLTKEAMPVIRYRTRDLTRLLPGAGRAMRRIERVKGRSDDMLIIRGVNVFPSQIEAALVEEQRLAPHYLLEVKRPHRLDELDVVVEMRPDAADALTPEAHAAVERRAEEIIKARVGVTTTVRVVAPGAIQRSQGKAKRVVDLRTKD